MAIQKNFVIKNGVEINSNLIFGDAVTDRVGIGTTRPTDTLHVVGGIAATSINLSGVGTIPVLSGTALNYSTGNIVTGIITSISGSTINYSGIVTGGSYRVGNTEVISSARELKNIVSLDATTTATIESAIANSPNTFTDLNVTGISTLNTVGISSNLNVSGNTTLNTVGISSNLNVSGISTLGSVKISSGIVTASSGIVTYYGDGQYLQNITSGVGVATAGGTVGTGATILDFRGAGISTVTVSAGIATINITGGGGGGAVSIGTIAPPSPSNGDLWYSPDYGRTFVWYNEVTLGIGSTAVWVDASPFNVNLSQLDDLQVTNLVVTQRSSLNNLNVTGISTLGNKVKVGVGSTALIVEGDARITGILTVGTSSLTLNGNTNQINGVTISSGIVTASSFVGNGSGLTNVGGIGTQVNINTSGIVTASSFVGNGSGLTNVGGIGTQVNINTSGIVTASTYAISGVTIIDSNRNLGNVGEILNNIGNTGANCTINLNNGTFVTATLSANCQFTFSNPTAGGASSFILVLTNDATAGRSITWPVSVKWPANTVPTRTTTANRTDVYTFFTSNGGTTWVGSLAQYDYSL